MLRALGIATTGAVAGCASSPRGETPDQTDRGSPTTVGTTRGVELTASYTSLSAFEGDRPVWVVPDAHGSVIRTALDRGAFTAEAFDRYPDYDLTGLQNHAPDKLPSRRLETVRINDENYRLRAVGGPASTRRLWYTAVTDSTTPTPVEALSFGRRILVDRLFDNRARGRENALEVTFPERVSSGLVGSLVRREATTYRIEGRVVETPTWPPRTLSVGYRLDPTDDARVDLRVSPPVPTDALDRLLTDGLRLRPTDERYRTITDADPVLLSLVNAWTISEE